MLRASPSDSEACKPPLLICRHVASRSQPDLDICSLSVVLLYANMATPDPARMAETIAAAFMKVAHERALEKKISSLQETIATLQDRHQEETKAIRETIAALESRHNQEIQVLGRVVNCLEGQKDGHNEHDEELDSLQETVKSLQGLAKKAESDNARLQDEIAELRAQLDRTEYSTVNEISRPHEPRQQLQQPPQRQPQHDQSSENTYEETLLPQHENEESVQFLSISGHGRSFLQQQNMSLEQPHPRGVKRAHVGDAAEPPPARRVAPAQAQEANDSREPRRFMTSKSNSTRAHDDEAPHREEKRQVRVEDRTAARQREFVDYFKSMREQYKADNYGTNQRAFVCRFIDGIQDPVLSRWFQESLRARFPEKVHDEKRSTRKAGGRIVAPTRDLNWKDIETVLKYTPWPSMTD